MHYTEDTSLRQSLLHFIVTGSWAVQSSLRHHLYLLSICVLFFTSVICCLPSYHRLCWGDIRQGNKSSHWIAVNVKGEKSK